MLKRIKQIKFNSIKLKVSLFYTAVLGVILLLYTAVLFLGQRYLLERDQDSELAIEAQEIGNAINSFLPVLEDDQRAFRSVADFVIRQKDISFNDDKFAKAQKRWLAVRDKLDLHNDYIVLASPNAEVISSSRNVYGPLLTYLLKNISASQESALAYHNLTFGVNKMRLIVEPYYYKNKRIYLIGIASSRTLIARVLYGRMMFALVTIACILLFTSFLGGLITRRILRPVMEVANIAKNITYRDLNARVKIEDVDEELRYLVDAFNEMISRLDHSFRYIDEFSSNVAHELKTPLTITSGESELALMQERDAGEYRRVIGSNLREAGNMLNIVEDLLLLSRLEYKPEGFKFEQIDFIIFIKEVYEQAIKLALPKNIEVKLGLVDKEIAISGDWLHLRRLFINLLNNAVKFTPEGGKIILSVKAGEGGVEASVADSGIGISADNIDKIFRRFFRVDDAGLAGKSGSGLGLSIVNSIAKIHRADIKVSSQLGKGSTFTVILPY